MISAESIWMLPADGVALTLQSAGVNVLAVEGWVAVAAAAALYYGLTAPDGATPVGVAP